MNLPLPLFAYTRILMNKIDVIIEFPQIYVHIIYTEKCKQGKTLVKETLAS